MDLLEAPTDAVLDHVLAGHPDVRRELGEAWDAAWTATDPVVLELCRLRVAMLLGCAAEGRSRTPTAVAAGLDEVVVGALPDWPRSTHVDERTRACLAFTEQWVVDVAGMDDATVAAVRGHLGEQGLADFVSALLVVEQRQRLRLAWSRVLGAAA